MGAAMGLQGKQEREKIPIDRHFSSFHLGDNDQSQSQSQTQSKYMGNFPRAWLQGGVNPPGDVTAQSTTGTTEPAQAEVTLYTWSQRDFPLNELHGEILQSSTLDKLLNDEILLFPTNWKVGVCILIFLICELGSQNERLLGLFKLWHPVNLHFSIPIRE